MSADLKTAEESKADPGEKSYHCSWAGCDRVYTTPGSSYFEFCVGYHVF